MLGNWLTPENTGTPLKYLVPGRLLRSTPRHGPLFTTDPPPMFSPEPEVGEAIACTIVCIEDFMVCCVDHRLAVAGIPMSLSD